MTEHHNHAPARGRRPFHKDWRVWTGIVLMLAAITIYVLSLDDSLLSLSAVRTFC